MEIKTFIIVLLLPVFSSALECFQCDPRDKTCVLPEIGTTSVINCEGSFQTPNPDAMLMTKTINEYSNRNIEGNDFCYYLFIVFDTNQEGVYRGCARCNPTVIDFCNEFKRIMKVGNMTYCHYCHSDNCNDIEFDSKTHGFKPRPGEYSKSLIPHKKVIDKVDAVSSSVTQSYKLMLIFFMNIIHFLYVSQY